MEFIFMFLLAFIAAIVGVFYFLLAIFAMLLPIIFWVFLIWLVIRIIKKYT
jgi:hypothetical protein